MIFEGQSPSERGRQSLGDVGAGHAVCSFARLGIGLTAGRAFSDADSRTAAPVAIVSEAVARRYWPGQDPIGKRLRVAAEFPWVTVVGVARDMRYRELTKAWMTVYFPAEQFFFFAPGSLVVRSGMPARDRSGHSRGHSSRRNPTPRSSRWRRWMRCSSRELSRPRAAMTAAALFAMLAILPRSPWVYAVLAGDVRQRRRELAIRSAIGATPGRILREVLSRSSCSVVSGSWAGLIAAAAATQYPARAALTTSIPEIRRHSPSAGPFSSSSSCWRRACRPGAPRARTPRLSCGPTGDRHPFGLNLAPTKATPANGALRIAPRTIVSGQNRESPLTSPSWS